MTQATLPGLEARTTFPTVNLAFARHETFHPRFGWLKKGYDAAKKDREVFLRDDATVILGVGKNMVRSIRYWCRAYKILQDDVPTPFGEKLLGDEGWDPFLEDPASLWLLHWRLLQSPCEATAWYVTFNIFRAVEFEGEDLFKALQDYIETQGRKFADSSLKKDVSCILRMYVESEAQKGVSEDSIDCPFAELGIIQPSGDGRRYSFRVGAKYNLPSEVIVASCLEFARVRGEQKTISVSSLSYDPGSPGLAFKLSESAICAAIEELAPQYDSLSLSGAAGLIQFAFTEDPIKLADEILNEYYGRRKRREIAKNVL